MHNLHTIHRWINKALTFDKQIRMQIVLTGESIYSCMVCLFEKNIHRINIENKVQRIVVLTPLFDEKSKLKIRIAYKMLSAKWMCCWVQPTFRKSTHRLMQIHWKKIAFSSYIINKKTLNAQHMASDGPKVSSRKKISNLQIGTTDEYSTKHL